MHEGAIEAFLKYLSNKDNCILKPSDYKEPKKKHRFKVIFTAIALVAVGIMFYFYCNGQYMEQQNQKIEMQIKKEKFELEEKEEEENIKEREIANFEKMKKLGLEIDKNGKATTKEQHNGAK
ncbi:MULTISPECIES: hypothetical protein [Clostridium]|jgi:cell division protein FtsB|uniref:hypothetical protein n=1 Tax=Clostridium TaxID=1485 RepID=UPI002431B45D|nr:hypothetical protein [Clostridium tyrobutyricum]